MLKNIVNRDIMDVWIVEGNIERYFKIDKPLGLKSSVGCSTGEDIKKFISLMNNPLKYRGKILMNYRYKNGKLNDNEKREEIDPEEFKKYIGANFNLYSTSLIKFHDSLEEIFENFQN